MGMYSIFFSALLSNVHADELSEPITVSTGVSPQLIPFAQGFNVVNTYLRDAELRILRDELWARNPNNKTGERVIVVEDVKTFKVDCKNIVRPSKDLPRFAEGLLCYLRKMYMEGDSHSSSLFRGRPFLELKEALLQVIEALHCEWRDTDYIEFASLMSNILHSTAGLRNLEEIGSNDLYRARGIIQMKGEQNYALATRLLRANIQDNPNIGLSPIDFVRCPEKMAELTPEAMTASLLVWYELIDNYKKTNKDLIPGLRVPTLTLTGTIVAVGASDFYVDFNTSVINGDSLYNRALLNRLQIFYDVYYITTGCKINNSFKLIGYKFDRNTVTSISAAALTCVRLDC